MLKIGLIGCGFMGTMHANCYKNIPGVTLAAVADLRPEKAAACAEGTDAKIYADGLDLIREADVDAIDICLPTYLHTKFALAAMERVKYVFIEKPAALTLDEGKALLEKSAATGCRVQIGQVIRFWDEYVELAKIIESGAYGRVVNANFRRISPRPTWGWNNWMLDSTLSGGAGQDLHIHDVDYILSVFGRPEAFYSVKNTLSETNSYVSTLMRYADFAVSVEGTWDLPGSYPFTAAFRVTFERAAIEYAAGKLLRYDADGVHEIKIEKKELAGANAGGNISDLGGYYNELLYFTAQAASGGEIERAALPDAIESLEFVLGELNF